MEIKEITLNDKKIAIVRTSGGDNETVKLSNDKSKSRVLNDKQLKELARYY